MSIDLQKFCLAEGSRWNLDKPFILGAYQYATNGHIALRFAGFNTMSNTPGKFPPIAELFPAAVDPNQLIALPEKPAFVDNVSKCQACGGGTYDHKDIELNDDGDCIECYGITRYLDSSIELIAGYKLSARYAYLLRTLPNVRYWPKSAVHLYFVFDGGDGVLMPLS